MCVNVLGVKRNFLSVKISFLICLEERSFDSLENTQEKKIINNDGENMSDASLQKRPDDVASSRSDVADTEDKEGHSQSNEDIQSRKSSISIGITKSHPEVNPETARSDTR